MAKQKQTVEFTGQDLVYYNALMKVRNDLSEQIRVCSDELLDCTNSENAV